MNLFDRIFEAKANPDDYTKYIDYPEDPPSPSTTDVDAYNKKFPKEPISDTEPLGSGIYGSVYRTVPGRVVKLDQGATEKTLYDKMPKYVKKNPVTPQKVKTGEIYYNPALPDRRSIISREDILNLDHQGVDRKVAPMLQKLRLAIDDTRISFYRDRFRVPEKTLKPALFSTLYDWHKQVEAHPDLESKDKERLHKFGKGFARYLHHGVMPRDLHSDNLGKRKDGSLVMRDLGLYGIISDHPDKVSVRNRSKPKIIKGNVIAKATAKLKNLSKSEDSNSYLKTTKRESPTSLNNRLFESDEELRKAERERKLGDAESHRKYLTLLRRSGQDLVREPSIPPITKIAPVGSGTTRISRMRNLFRAVVGSPEGSLRRDLLVHSIKRLMQRGHLHNARNNFPLYTSPETVNFEKEAYQKDAENFSNARRKLKLLHKARKAGAENIEQAKKLVGPID